MGCKVAPRCSDTGRGAQSGHKPHCFLGSQSTPKIGKKRVSLAAMLPPPDLSPPEILPGAAGSSRADGSRFERPSLEGFKLPQLPQRQPRSPAGPTQPHTVLQPPQANPAATRHGPTAWGLTGPGPGPGAGLRRPRGHPRRR